MKKSKGLSLSVETCNFDIVTYVSVYHLIDILKIHGLEIRAWAYAHHNKDVHDSGELKEPHTHVILRLYRKVRLSTVIKWFSCTDEFGVPINTRAISCSGRVQDCFEYLIHKNDPDKFQYDSAIIRCSDVTEFVGYQSYNDDSLKCALFDIVDKNACTEELAFRYGRDFIIHRKAVEETADKIRADRARGIKPQNVKMRELQCDFFDGF